MDYWSFKETSFSLIQWICRVNSLCKECVWYVRCCVHTSQSNIFVNDWWLCWQCIQCIYNVYITYLQHTYTRECIVIGVDTVVTVVTVVTHSQIYYSAMIFMQCVCWLLIEIILHIPMKLFLQGDLLFHFHFEKIFLTVLTELIT